MSPTDRMLAFFEERVQRTDECWLWTGALSRNGYGQMHVRGVHVYAHRFAYEYWQESIPPGLDLDHLCRVRHCVNPAHLEPVTRSENIRRGQGPSVLGRLNGAKSHCVNSHEFTPENTYRRPSGGRACRQCERDRRAARTPAQQEDERRKSRERGRASRLRDPEKHRAAARRAYWKKKVA